MYYIYVCNTSADYISKINLKSFNEECKITLNSDYSNKIGPHGVYFYNGILVVANSYSNTISMIDTKEGKEVENYFIGMHCNDLVVYNNIAYVVCGELNNIVVFDLNTKKVLEEIPCGSLPHSISINKDRNKIIISNMGDDSIAIIDCKNNQCVTNVRVGAYPTKAIFTNDGQHALICESNLGADKKGHIGIVSLENYRVVYRVEVGKAPIDLCCKDKYCYVSNFGEGTISVVDFLYYEEVKKIELGGMPRGIIQHENYLYVGDNFKNLLTRINLTNNHKKRIPIGGEPTGMALVRLE